MVGDFKGGALNFDDGTKVEGNREWHRINGHMHHWNDHHGVTKYSVVLCKGTKKPKRKRLAIANVRSPSEIKTREYRIP